MSYWPMPPGFVYASCDGHTTTEYLTEQPEHVPIANPCRTAGSEDKNYFPGSHMLIACPPGAQGQGHVTERHHFSRPCPFPLAAQETSTPTNVGSGSGWTLRHAEKTKAHIRKQRLNAGQGGGGSGGGDFNPAVAGFQSRALQLLSRKPLEKV